MPRTNDEALECEPFYNQLWFWLVLSLAGVLFFYATLGLPWVFPFTVAVLAVLPIALCALLSLRGWFCLALHRCPDLHLFRGLMLRGVFAVLGPVLVLILMTMAREGAMGEALRLNIDMHKSSFQHQTKFQYTSNSMTAGSITTVTQDGKPLVQHPVSSRVNAGPAEVKTQEISFSGADDRFLQILQENFGRLVADNVELTGEVEIDCPLPGWQMPLSKSEVVSYTVRAKFKLKSVRGTADISFDGSGELTMEVTGFCSRATMIDKIPEQIGPGMANYFRQEMGKLQQKIR